MKFPQVHRLIATTAFLTLFGCQNPTDSDVKIVGGSEVFPENFPGEINTVGVKYSPEYLPHCSGVLVAPNMVLTSGHCLPHWIVGTPKTLYVYFTHSSGIEEHRKVVSWQAFRNEAFRKAAPNFDVALLKFEGESPEVFKPATLLADIDLVTPQKTIRLVGHGYTKTKDREYNGKKRWVDTVIDQYIEGGRVFGLFRFGPTPGRGACSGDSGGPAYIEDDGRWYLAGITMGVDHVLQKTSDCETGVGLYTFIGQYHSWLEEKTGTEFERLGETPQLASEWPTTIPDHDNILDWCNDRNLPELEWLTVKYFIDPYKTYDCTALNRRIVDTKELVYRGEKFAPISLTLIASLKDVETLTVQSVDPKIEDVTPLAKMQQLKHLTLSWHNIKDVSSLAQLENLETLNLDKNQIRSITALKALKKLKVLSVKGNPIEDKVCPLENGVCHFEY